MNTQTTELDKVKARIRAAASKTVDRGCSEEEAMAAASMVGRLLAQYNLTMNEVDVRDAACVTVAIDSGSKNRDALWNVAFNIGAFCGCKVWFQGSARHSKSNAVYKYFGHESDILMAEYLFKIILASIATEWAVFKTTPTYLAAKSSRVATNSFKLGMSRRIGSRLAVMHQDAEDVRREAEAELRRTESKKAKDAFRQANADRAAKADAIAEMVAENAPISLAERDFVNQFNAEARAAAQKIVGGTSLIVLKGQLVEAEYEKLGMKLRMIRPKTRSGDANAYAKGQNAGEKVNLRRPLGQSNNVSGLLA